MNQFLNLIKSISKYNYSGLFSNILSFFFAKFAELKIMKEKLCDLEKTNFELGIRKMQEKRFGEAIFRFRIVKKFWPNNHQAYIHLIECLILKNKLNKAQLVADELTTKDQKYTAEIAKIIQNKK